MRSLLASLSLYFYSQIPKDPPRLALQMTHTFLFRSIRPSSTYVVEVISKGINFGAITYRHSLNQVHGKTGTALNLWSRCFLRTFCPLSSLFSILTEIHKFSGPHRNSPPLSDSFYLSFLPPLPKCTCPLLIYKVCYNSYFALMFIFLYFL